MANDRAIERYYPAERPCRRHCILVFCCQPLAVKRSSRIIFQRGESGVRRAFSLIGSQTVLLVGFWRQQATLPSRASKMRTKSMCDFGEYLVVIGMMSSACYMRHGTSCAKPVSYFCRSTPRPNHFGWRRTIPRTFHQRTFWLMDEFG